MNAHGRQFYPQFYVNGNFLNVRIVMLGSQDDVVPFTVGQLKKNDSKLQGVSNETRLFVMNTTIL